MLTSWAPMACQSQPLEHLNRSPCRCWEKGCFAGTGNLVVVAAVLCL